MLQRIYGTAWQTQEQVCFMVAGKAFIHEYTHRPAQSWSLGSTL